MRIRHQFRMISNGWLRALGCSVSRQASTESVIEENPMSEENNDLKRLSRRNLLKAGAAAGVAAALPAGPAQAAQPVAESRGGGSDAAERTFVHGPIHTVDEPNNGVRSVAIRDGRFVPVGNAAHPARGSHAIK